MDHLMTRDEVAAMVGNITANAVKLAAQRREIAYVKVKNRYLFREDDVRAWIESRRVPALAATAVKAKLTARSAARRSRAS